MSVNADVVDGLLSRKHRWAPVSPARSWACLEHPVTTCSSITSSPNAGAVKPIPETVKPHVSNTRPYRQCPADQASILRYTRITLRVCFHN